MTAVTPASWQERLRQFLAARTRRERLLLGLGAAGVLLALLVQLALLPAWRRLQSAPQEQAQLDAQWQRMQALKAQSASLLRQSRRPFDEAALRTSLSSLGNTAQLSLNGERAELRLQGARPEALADWLLQARTQAGAVVREARLQRTPQDGQPAWSGVLLLDLPR